MILGEHMTLACPVEMELHIFGEQLEKKGTSLPDLML
jgi:hypothetical protein